MLNKLQTIFFHCRKNLAVQCAVLARNHVLRLRNNQIELPLRRQSCNVLLLYICVYQIDQRCYTHHEELRQI